MREKFRLLLPHLPIVILAGTTLFLGLQIRSLQARNRGLVTRFTEPHPGMLVPSFAATSIRHGDSIAIGEAAGDRRQVLFFLTTTCEYCIRSLPILRSLDSALKSRPDMRAELYLIGLDSARLVRRFADSAALSLAVLQIPNQRLALLYRVRAVPQLMVLDSAGRIVFTRAGALLSIAARDSILTAVRFRAIPVAALTTTRPASQ